MLGDFDGNRRNNFTALRILFAWLVLYGHSFPITGKGVVDPLGSIFQGSTWIGEIAVSGFFAISGFLVAASFVRRGLLDYTISRVLRIYPALVVCVLLTTLVLGPAFSSLDRAAYFSAAGTWDYLWNATLAFPIDFQLPGVFEEHPRRAVNGSLWTLPVEMSCYILLVVAGIAGILQSRALTNLAHLSLLLFASQHFTDLPLIGYREKWSRPALYFLWGVALYANRQHIPMHWGLALLAGTTAWMALGETWFMLAFPPAFSYLVFYLAYRTPFLNVDGRIGDPSYGMYIYAWPAQQIVVAGFPSEGPYFNTGLATLMVMVLALLSWFLLEKPALKLKRRLVRRQSTRPL
jgi:peptidoglycan/LPS O-acetylase OafA/YrhL